MAHGKSQFCTWFCQVCHRANKVSTYNKKSTDKVKTVLKRYCPQCRKSTEHKRKDTKKGGGQQAKK